MRNIAVLAGGYTSERHISLKSGQQIVDSLDRNIYNVYLVDVSEKGFFVNIKGNEILVDMNSFSFLSEKTIVQFDYAYISIHGSPGEDGKIQSYLELVNVPYSSCDSLASVLTFDKVVCKKILSNTNIQLAESFVVKGEAVFSVEDVVETVGLPCFVKPNTAGSSFGITKVYNKEDIVDAVNNAQKEDSIVIIEEFVEGVEVSCGVYKTALKSQVLPVTEIDTKNDYFDTEAKYNPELTDEITPARISDEETKLVQDTCSELYDRLNCSGLVRIDFIIKNSIPYFLEVNSIPGMSAESIIPKQVRTQGLSLTEVFADIIEDSFN